MIQHSGPTGRLSEEGFKRLDETHAREKLLWRLLRFVSLLLPEGNSIRHHSLSCKVSIDPYSTPSPFIC
jgi:hypothetical protein